MVMKNFLYAFCFLFISLAAQAQWHDDFSDGNFSENPAWLGDDSSFIINTSKQLQLNALDAGLSCLSTDMDISNHVEWHFFIKLGFDPSSSNLAKVYLVSDKADLKAPLNGYYLKFGETGVKDAIELYKQTGTTSTLLCRGKDSLIAKAFSAQVKVVLKDGNTWEIYADTKSTGNLSLQASCADENNIAKGYFGVCCLYTKTNAKNFYFDDFQVNKILSDSIPPKVSKIEMLAANKMRVTFNEKVETTGVTVDKFYVNTIDVYPESVIASPNYVNAFELTFAKNFISDKEYILNVKNIKDLEGNIMEPEELLFSYHAAKLYDVLINEIMADPVPVIGLPEAEYIELYNRSDFETDLHGWQLKIGNVQKNIPYIKMPAKSYFIVANATDTAKFSGYGKVIGISGLSLSNTGNTLLLSNAQGDCIHTVSYTDGWYQDNAKKDGGWSLEMIDPLNPCAGIENWKASVDVLGGTPGKQNAAWANNPDKIAPAIINVSIIDSLHIKVNFTETLDSLDINNTAHYFIDNQIANPVAASANYPQNNAVILTLQKPLVQGKLYNLTVKKQLHDCVGNTFTSDTSVPFALPQDIAHGDIIINEILFNPNENCVDFVEIYNKSDKILDLSELILTNYDTLAKKIIKYVKISEQPLLIFPATYLVLSTDSAALKKCYKTENPLAFLDMKSFISMNADKGSVAIATVGAQIIDVVLYNEKMHFPLLINTKGVSLERLHFDMSSNLPDNWHSASSNVGYATPGYKNSQAVLQNTENSEIQVSPDIFSPDNDGYNDFLSIAYNFDKAGNMMSVKIYDEWGRLIKDLVNNKFCGIKGEFIWDGTTDDKNKASIGRYILHIEVFNLDGKKKQYKKTAVIGGFLK